MKGAKYKEKDLSLSNGELSEQVRTPERTTWFLFL